MSYDKAELYGTTATEWVNRWDAGRSIWTIEMGGLGPGYEQALQTFAVELTRDCLAAGIEIPEDGASDELTKTAFERVREQSFKTCKRCDLGLSGAQAGAAMQLAYRVMRDGPYGSMKTAPQDRHIQVSRTWPQVANR